MQYRWNIFRNIRNAIDQNEGGFDKFSQGGYGTTCSKCVEWIMRCLTAMHGTT